MRKHYAVYDRVTGAILRTGTCPPSMFALQATQDAEAVVEGVANDLNHRVVDGQIVAKEAEP